MGAGQWGLKKAAQYVFEKIFGVQQASGRDYQSLFTALSSQLDCLEHKVDEIRYYERVRLLPDAVDKERLQTLYMNNDIVSIMIVQLILNNEVFKQIKYDLSSFQKQDVVELYAKHCWDDKLMAFLNHRLHVDCCEVDALLQESTIYGRTNKETMEHLLDIDARKLYFFRYHENIVQQSASTICSEEFLKIVEQRKLRLVDLVEKRGPRPFHAFRFRYNNGSEFSVEAQEVYSDKDGLGILKEIVKPINPEPEKIFLTLARDCGDNSPDYFSAFMTDDTLFMWGRRKSPRAIVDVETGRVYLFRTYRRAMSQDGAIPYDWGDFYERFKRITSAVVGYDTDVSKICFRKDLDTKMTLRWHVFDVKCRAEASDSELREMFLEETSWFGFDNRDALNSYLSNTKFEYKGMLPSPHKPASGSPTSPKLCGATMSTGQVCNAKVTQRGASFCSKHACPSCGSVKSSRAQYCSGSCSSPPKGQAGSREIRGRCQQCGLSVYSDQPRNKTPEGNYVHAACTP